MIALLDDLNPDAELVNAWTPLPLAAGDICERCWLEVRVFGLGDWSDHDRAVRGTRNPACPHGEVPA